ncbi:MAG: hypothetical protein WCO45_11315 [Pseudanabaena sp. ELA607]
MRYFHRVQRVPISPAILAQAEAFAQKVTPTIGMDGQGYQDSQQTNMTKIRQDHYVSKVGEAAVAISFQNLGRVVQGPDYGIYHGRQKSWDADLYIDAMPLAVKTQTTMAAAKYGLSWTFQAGKYRQDPILGMPLAWVCFVEFNQSAGYCNVYPPYQIHELTFAAPRLAYLKDSKKVVYAADLADPHPNSLR